MTHHPDDAASVLRPDLSLGVVMNVKPGVTTSPAVGWAIAIWIAQPASVALLVGDVLGDKRAAFLGGRGTTDEAGCSRRRELVATHGVLRFAWQQAKCPTSSPLDGLQVKAKVSS